MIDDFSIQRWLYLTELYYKQLKKISIQIDSN